MKTNYNGLSVIHPEGHSIRRSDVEEALVNFFGSEEEISNEGTVFLEMSGENVQVSKHIR